jgi:hypothetical protein
MSIIPYFLYLVLIAFHEVILQGATSIRGVSINLPAILVFTVALHKSESATAWFAFFTAIVMCAGTPLTMGWNALGLVVLSVTIYHAREQLNLDSMAAKLILLIAGVLAHNILNIAINQPSDFGYQLWRIALTGTLYTGGVAYLLYAFFARMTSGRRARTLF